MGRNYDMILSAEEKFARLIALEALVKRPLTVWHYLIPGMSIIDFLRRPSEIRRYSEHFLFSRKLALDAAQDRLSGKNKGETVFQVSEAIKQYLNSLSLYSEDLHRNQTQMVQLLIDHHNKLIGSEGKSYYSLVEHAYGDKKDYETYLSRLASAEQEVDRATVEKLGDTEAL